MPGRLIGEKIGKSAYEFGAGYFNNRITGINPDQTGRIYPNPMPSGHSLDIKSLSEFPRFDRYSIHSLAGKQLMDPITAYQMIDILQGVITRGTAQNLRSLERPLFGKTGTSSGPTNVWFVGGSPDMVAGVYLGYDQPRNMGGYAQANERTAVADGAQVDAWLDSVGRQVFVDGHPSPESPVSVSGSAAGVTVISAPGAGISLYICRGQVHASGNENKIKLREGAAGTIRWQHDCANGGGGSKFDFGSRGWKLPANTGLIADIDSAAGWINIEQYYIAP